MRVLLAYGVITGGGCERRMGDLCRYLLDEGHEAWIAASTFDALGEAVLHGQCGVPLNRVLYYAHPDGGFRAPFMQDWIAQIVREREIDLVDVQWHPGFDPVKWDCPSIATIHGVTSRPPASIFDGVIAVEDRIIDGDAYKHGAAVIWNWVNLRRFPFREELGEGICFAGRAFKAVNVRKLLQYYDGPVDGYGTSTAAQLDMPDAWRWHGFADLAEVFPRYRIVFASAQTAMEAMAAGRFVIAGQSLHLQHMGTHRPEGCLVTPDNVGALARANSFSYRRGYEPTSREVWADVQTALENDMPEERRALRAWVEERHSLEVQCGKIVEYYRQVAG